MFDKWWFYVVLYLIFSVSFNQFYKLCTKKSAKDGALVVLLQWLAGLIVLVLCPLFPFQFPTDIKIYIFLGLAIIFYAITDRVNGTARRGIEASTFGIIQQIQTVFMIMGGLIFLKEPFILKQIIGAILIIIGNVLIFYHHGKFKFDKYLLLGIVGNVSLSIALFLDVNISSQFNLPIYIALTLLLPGTLIFLFDKLKFKDLKNEYKIGDKKNLFITAIAWSLLIICMLKAYQLGSVTTVAPLSALTVIINVIVAYIFLKERKDLLKKIIAAIIIIISIILINV